MSILPRFPSHIAHGLCSVLSLDPAPCELKFPSYDTTDACISLTLYIASHLLRDVSCRPGPCSAYRRVYCRLNSFVSLLLVILGSRCIALWPLASRDEYGLYSHSCKQF